MSTWLRTFSAGMGWTTTGGSALLASIPRGSTLVRTRFSWGYGGHTNTAVDLAVGQTLIMIGGLVTTVGNGTETVPKAIDNRGDASPPMQRWLWWESRVPVITAIDSADNVISWQSGEPQEPVDAHGMVATSASIPVGDTLNLWFSYQADTAWDASGEARLWVASSVLYQ